MDNKELSITSDSEYKKLLSELKEKVRSSQLKAAIKVNYELLDLYWTLGEYIVKNQEQHSWGDAFIKSLAKDLQKEFPDMKGFSETNIKYIRRWYSFYIKGLQGFHYHRGRIVLRDISFTLPAGRVMCLLGPNGTGKTTLLRCLLGLLRPDEGRFLWDGRDLSALTRRARARLMAYVPQSSALTFPYEVQEVVLKIGRAHVCTPVTMLSRMPSSA